MSLVKVFGLFVLDKPQIAPSLNVCDDPTDIYRCEFLDKELCICKDNDVKSLCQGYCDNSCRGYTRNQTLIDRDCQPIQQVNSPYQVHNILVRCHTCRHWILPAST